MKDNINFNEGDANVRREINERYANSKTYTKISRISENFRQIFPVGFRNLISIIFPAEIVAFLEES